MLAIKRCLWVNGRAGVLRVELALTVTLFQTTHRATLLLSQVNRLHKLLNWPVFQEQSLGSYRIAQLIIGRKNNRR